MNRREFITHLGILGGLSMAPSSLLAAMNKDLSTYQLFQQAMTVHPQLIAHQNYTQERTVEQLLVEGKFPKNLKGTLYRNGPALFERNAFRYDHLFEGDGMIQAFDFDNGKVAFKNKFIKTNKFKKEQKAGRFLYDFNNAGLKDPEPITSSDTINPANTNILPVGDEVWALWEAGSAHRLDANTLQTSGVVTLSDQLKGMPFSAHPKVDADGTIWNFGLDFASGKIILYKLNAKGELQKFSIVDSNYHAMLHDFLITDKHILIILPSIEMEATGKGFMQSQKFNEDQPMRVMVIDKHSMTLKSTHEFPACFIFHYGNAWEESDGTIKFDGCRYNDVSIMQVIGEAMSGKLSTKEKAHAVSVLFSIKPNGVTEQHFFDGISEFPRIYPAMTGLKNDKIFSIGAQKNDQWMHKVRSINLDTGKVDEFDYGHEYLIEEHIVVENGKRQKDGYLLGTALHWPSKKSCVSLFDAENIAAGPIARAWLPFHIPLGFHGNFKKV